MDLLLINMRLFTSQDINWCTGSCGLLVDYCDVFNQLFGLSFWRHPFTAEDPLVRKQYNATFLWMAWWWVHFQQISIVVWTIPLITLVVKSLWHMQYHFGLIALFACLCMFMCVWLTRFLCIRSPSSVHRERVPLWQPALHSWPLGLRPWQRLRGQFWRERLRWVKEKKRQQKGKSIKRGMERAVALATMFNIIILYFYYRLVLSGWYLNAIMCLDTLWMTYRKCA